ncbi:hypothetical protein ACFPIF_15690 [Brevundimonas faecalis]|uniref:hypothetical protein n=1 Tax=Brevundimonas faecalis TaxID=947378 RepID=UPI0036173D28
MGFVHDEDFETPRFTPQDIRDCDDSELLRDWLDELEDARGDIKSQIEAAQVTGLVDRDWLERSRGAHAFAGMGIKRVKRRLRELGVAPEPKEEVEGIKTAWERCKTDLGNARAAGVFGRCLVSCVKEALPEAAANAILAEASKRVTAMTEPSA